MRSLLSVAVLAASMAAAPAVMAQSLQDLITKNGCAACHAVDKKLVGPAYKDVSAKYKGQKDASAKLYDKVKKGGSGVWGQVPMPPNPQVSDADLKNIIKGILAL